MPNSEAGHPRATVDLIVVRTIDEQPHALTIRSSSGLYFNAEALPGGAIDDRETFAAAAVRVLETKCGLRIETGDLFTLDHYDGPNRDAREWTISIAFMVDADALAARGPVEPVAGAGVLSLAWIPVAVLVDEIDRGNLLAHDHSLMIRDAAHVLTDAELWPPKSTKARGTSLRDRV